MRARAYVAPRHRFGRAGRDGPKADMDASPASNVEGSQDRAWPGASFPALPRQPAEGVAGTLKVGDLGVERLDPSLRKLAGTGAILTGVQLQKLPDLLEREPRRLRLPDEPQPPHVVPAVVPDPAPARRRPEQVRALVEA